MLGWPAKPEVLPIFESSAGWRPVCSWCQPTAESSSQRLLSHDEVYFSDVSYDSATKMWAVSA